MCLLNGVVKIEYNILMDFRKINLGKADAQEEGVEFPDLLLNGYYEKDDIVNLVYQSSKYLFLGYKGSGKSALSEHIKLSAGSGVCIEQQSLKDFPYKTLSKMITGDSEIEYKLKISWRWLLLVQILSNLINDKDAKLNDSRKLTKLTDFLTQEGIFPLINISSLVTKTTSRTFKSSVKAFSFETTTKNENAQLSAPI